MVVKRMTTSDVPDNAAIIGFIWWRVTFTRRARVEKRFCADTAVLLCLVCIHVCEAFLFVMSREDHVVQSISGDDFAESAIAGLLLGLGLVKTVNWDVQTLCNSPSELSEGDGQGYRLAVFKNKAFLGSNNANAKRLVAIWRRLFHCLLRNLL